MIITQIAHTLLRLPTLGRVAGAARSFAAAPSGEATWSLGGQVIGVIGPDKVINALIRFSARLALRSSSLDKAAANEMVALMKARAPRDTGRLWDGIQAIAVEGAWIVEATAQRDGNSADYARMVEFGTQAGERGRRVASDAYFAGPYAGRRGSINAATGRRRRAADARRLVRRTHPGTDPQPYFVPSVREVLERRGIAMADLGDQAAADEDLT